MRSRRYADRLEAGRVLAEHLTGYAGRGDVVVLGLPRGGVPVAAEVARVLDAALDVIIVRKLGAPGQPELAMGAVATVGGTVETVRHEPVLTGVDVSEETFQQARRRETAELVRREQLYRAGRPPVEVAGRVVIVVDDGLATGSTMRAAAAAVARQSPARLVVAVPVGGASTCRRLSADADEVVCAWTPEGFQAVGQGYRDFSQTSDEEVRLALASRPGPPAPPAPD